MKTEDELRRYGNKYETTKGLSSAEITKLIRSDIKAAVKSGELPPAKYSVSKHSYSLGWAVRVRVLGLPFPARDRDEARRIKGRIQTIADAYNWEDSDFRADYYTARFYCTVSIR